MEGQQCLPRGLSASQECLSRTILTQPGWQGVLGSWRLEYHMKTELVLDQGLDFVGYQLHWSQRPMQGICKTK